MKFTTKLLAAVLACSRRRHRACAGHQGRSHVSATGPAASLGIPERNTFPLMPQTIGGKKVHYIVLDDASDTTTAVKNTRKLITEDKVDVIVGSTVTPNSLAMNRRRRRGRDADGRDGCIEPHRRAGRCERSAGCSRHHRTTSRWRSSSCRHAEAWDQDGRLHRLRRRLRRGLVERIQQDRRDARIKVVGSERYNRADSSVTGQILSSRSRNPMPS